MDELLILGIVSFIAFIISFLSDKRRITNGVLLTLSVVLLLLGLGATLTEGPMNRLDQIVLFNLLLIGAFTPIFLLAVVVYLFQNARTLLKREGRKLPNLLSLFLGVGVLVFLIFLGVTLFTFEPLWMAATLYAGFYGFLFISFLVSSWLYSFNRPLYNKDYIIILGAGLKDGKRVPPLLAKRLDRACYFYHMQKKVSPPPKLIVTGGQGEDELISEASAMRAYLIERSIPSQQIIVEDVAKNTYENFSYSKQLFAQPTAKSVFITNHFHLFRSSLYARKLGLEAEGVGAAVTWYYLPNAYTREFIAILVMEKWIHVGIFVLFMASVLLLL